MEYQNTPKNKPTPSLRSHLTSSPMRRLSLLFLRSRATQSSLPPSLHGSRSHSPTGTAATQEDALTTPSDQPDAVLPDSDHHRVTQGGLDQGMTPLDQAHVPVAEQPRRQAREGKTSASTRSSHSSTKPSSAAKHSARSSRSTKPKTSHQKQPRS